MSVVYEVHFAVSGLTLWNSLPVTVCDPWLSLFQFCAHLNIVIFCRAYQTSSQCLRDSLGCKDFHVNIILLTYCRIYLLDTLPTAYYDRARTVIIYRSSANVMLICYVTHVSISQGYTKSSWGQERHGSSKEEDYAQCVGLQEYARGVLGRQREMFKLIVVSQLSIASKHPNEIVQK